MEPTSVSDTLVSYALCFVKPQNQIHLPLPFQKAFSNDSRLGVLGV